MLQIQSARHLKAICELENYEPSTIWWKISTIPYLGKMRSAGHEHDKNETPRYLVGVFLVNHALEKLLTLSKMMREMFATAIIFAKS